MKLPEKIRVGPIDYVVQRGEWGTYMGFHWKKGTLSVDETLRPQVEAMCAVHEVLHALFDQYDVKQGDNEEAVVRRLAFGLAALVRDNPGFVDYLKEALAA